MISGQARARRALPELVGVFGAYAALTVWWLWPLPAILATHTAYLHADSRLMVADVYLIMWALSWGAHALATAPWRLFHANSFYPSTLSLAYSEHFLGYQPLFAPAYWASGNPVLATNVVILLSHALCGLAMYLLARRFVGRPAAAVAGFFYAFHPWRLESLGHLHMLGVQYLPLALLFTERWLEHARRPDAVLLASSLALQMLSSVYLAYATALAYAVYLPSALWRWRARCDRRRLLGLALILGVVGAVLAASAVPYVILARRGLIPTYGSEETPTNLGLIPYFAAQRVWAYVRGLSVGPVGYLLAVVALLPPWRRRAPWLAALALTLVGVLAAFGTDITLGRHVLWSPYRLLVAWVPGFASIRLPTRFLVLTQLGLALLAGLGLGRLTARAPAPLGWAAAVVAAALALVSFRPFRPLPLHAEPTPTTVPAAYRWLAEHGKGRALLELPEAAFDAVARRMYLSTFHWLPIVEGYSAYPPRIAHHVHQIARGLPGEVALQELVDTIDVGWILVHRAEAQSLGAAWARSLPPGLERAGEWEGDLLVRVTAAAREGARRDLLSTRETPRGVPLVPLDRCSGWLELASSVPDPWRPLTSATLQVRVHNTGTSSWPGFGFVPRHLVRLKACVRGEGSPCIADAVPLPADVPPGGTLSVGVAPKSPLWGGAYELELSLLQVGDGPLARCGVAPLRVPVRVVGPLQGARPRGRGG